MHSSRVVVGALVTITASEVGMIMREGSSILVAIVAVLVAIIVLPSCACNPQALSIRNEKRIGIALMAN
jgi:hypothetical protein